MSITRERLQEIAEDGFLKHGESKELARMALAAMDSEPVEMPLDYLQGHKDGLEWASQLAEANHPETGDWLYDDPIELAKAIRKGPDIPQAQPAPEVPDYVLDALQKVARIRLDLNDFDGDRRGIADCLCDAEEALIEVVNRRAAMLADAKHDTTTLNSIKSVDSVAGKWIPVSERTPENNPWCYKYLVFETLNNRVNHDYWNAPDKGDDAFTPFWNYYGEHVTHWMPLPAAPQEEKP